MVLCSQLSSKPDNLISNLVEHNKVQKGDKSIGGVISELGVNQTNQGNQQSSNQHINNQNAQINQSINIKNRAQIPNCIGPSPIIVNNLERTNEKELNKDKLEGSNNITNIYRIV